MSVIHNDLLLATDEATGYKISKSLRLRGSASAYLNRTPASAGNQQKFTWSGWVKRGSLGSAQQLFGAGTWAYNTQISLIVIGSGDNLAFASGIYGTNTENNTATTQVFRDTSAWYHFVVAVDTTQGTASNRIKMYVNGQQITAFTQVGSYNIYPSQNYSYRINSVADHRIGNNPTVEQFDGYLADQYFIDGQQLTPSDFGETDAITGVWKPKEYAGTYGTNGFYLPFTDVATTSGSNAGLGKDFSGNGNYWTTNNISVTAGATYDSMTDVPTLTDASTANYAVLNPIHNPNGTNVTYNSANLGYSYSSGTANQMTVLSTIGITSGKFYWEFTEGSTVNSFSGVNTGLVLGGGANGIYYASTGGGITGSSAATYSGTALTTATGNIVGFAFDADALTLAVYKNNTLQGTFSGLESGKTWFPTIAPYTGSSGGSGSINFGQRPFAYTPPTGFKALNTYNLPDSTIVAGNKYMDATAYSGTGANATITNAGAFKPDLVWVKNRSSSENHALYDSVRGVNQRLVSNSTGAESTVAGVSAFNSNGFDINVNYSTSGQTYVGWQWQAGQGSTSSNISGTITSTVSANPSAGFSVVTYTGVATDNTNYTVGHGLGVAPAFVIIKNRGWASSANAWVTWHQSQNNKLMFLDSTGAADATDFTYMMPTAPTSSVLTVRSDSNVSTANRYRTNGRTDSYVAYCWAEIAGFSKFGSYTGNGSTDGTFVYTGFRPKFVLIKNTSSGTTNDWQLLDTTRDPSNVGSHRLYPNLSQAEDDVAQTDILSNGFKPRITGASVNGSGNVYIYAAFAEVPFKNSLGR